VRRRAIVNDDDFEKFNPENLMEEAQLNELSGLDNIGNTCYMNAVIQCLIRTPFFGSYLEQENFADALGDQLLV
jgi:ubiquitin C-terminal hydrolase